MRSVRRISGCGRGIITIMTMAPELWPIFTMKTIKTRYLEIGVRINVLVTEELRRETLEWVLQTNPFTIKRVDFQNSVMKNFKLRYVFKITLFA